MAFAQLALQDLARDRDGERVSLQRPALADLEGGDRFAGAGVRFRFIGRRRFHEVLEVGY
jgi:hypothetical protein